MLSIEEAYQRILKDLPLQPHETVSLTQGLGRVLSHDVKARVTLPPFDMASTDGYAVRSLDIDHVPLALKLSGESRAGDPFENELAAEHAVRIFSGAPVPSGADVVIPLRHTEAQDDFVVIKRKIPTGDNIRIMGVDFAENEPCLKAGRMLTSRDIGLAAAMNVPWLPVRRKPRIAIFSTGDELIMPGDKITASHVIASTNLALCAFVEAMGATAINLGLSSDEEDSIQRLAEAALGMDMVITTGGTSGGARELMIQAMRHKGIEMDALTIDLGNPEPLLYGKRGDTPVLGLPGNPVTAALLATLVLKPVVYGLLGTVPEESGPIFAKLGRNLDSNDLKMNFLRASLKRDNRGNLIAVPVSSQDNGMISILARSDCLVKVNSEITASGSPVEVVPLWSSLIST